MDLCIKRIKLQTAAHAKRLKEKAVRAANSKQRNKAIRMSAAEKVKKIRRKGPASEQSRGPKKGF